MTVDSRADHADRNEPQDEADSGRTLFGRRLRMAVEQLRQVPLGAAKAVTQRSSSRSGVNLIHFAPQAHQGAQTTARALQGGLETAGVPFSWFSSPTQGADGLRGDPREVLPVTVAYVQPANIPMVAARSPRLFSPKRTVVSLCYWETTDIKPLHRLGLPLLDEVWTISRYCQDVLSAHTSKPVKVMPHPVVKPDGEAGLLRQALGLDNQYLFGFQFDMLSTTQRKNPEGAIASYLKAFPKWTDATALIIKVLHGRAYPSDLARLRRLASGRPDIHVVDEWWPQDVNASFFVDIDTFVSLHRSEGFGLGMAQAMAAGKSVIATGYSGNLDFMTVANSLLVPYTLREVGTNPLYSPKSHWAEPDLDWAADAMRQVVAAPGDAQQLGRQAAHDMQRYSHAACGSWIVQELWQP